MGSADAQLSDAEKAFELSKYANMQHFMWIGHYIYESYSNRSTTNEMVNEFIAGKLSTFLESELTDPTEIRLMSHIGMVQLDRYFTTTHPYKICDTPIHARFDHLKMEEVFGRVKLKTARKGFLDKFSEFWMGEANAILDEYCLQNEDLAEIMYHNGSLFVPDPAVMEEEVIRGICAMSLEAFLHDLAEGIELNKGKEWVDGNNPVGKAINLYFERRFFDPKEVRAELRRFCTYLNFAYAHSRETSISSLATQSVCWETSAESLATTSSLWTRILTSTLTIGTTTTATNPGEKKKKMKTRMRPPRPCLA